MFRGVSDASSKDDADVMGRGSIHKFWNLTLFCSTYLFKLVMRRMLSRVRWAGAKERAHYNCGCAKG